MNDTITSSVNVTIEWTPQEDGSWEGKGDLYGASITPTDDGKYVATLYAPIPATRWEPEDVTEVAERVFADLHLARAWVLAKESEAVASELLAEIDVDEACAAAEAYYESAASFYDESAAAAIDAAIDSRRL